MQVVMTFKLKKKILCASFRRRLSLCKASENRARAQKPSRKAEVPRSRGIEPYHILHSCRPAPRQGPGRSTLAYSFTAFAATTERTSRPASINLALEGIDKQTKRTHAVRGLGKLMTSLAGRLQNLPFTALPLHG